MHGLFLTTVEVPIISGNRKILFESQVRELASNSMERYSYSTENPELTEFCDKTEEVQREYETGTVDCYQLAEGTIVHPKDRRIYGKFIALDGKVYETKWGPLKQRKRSKKAKRIKVKHDYPFDKLYSTAAEYAKAEYGYIFEESTRKLGYYDNPNVFYDWFSIGGGWTKRLLVKETCLECVDGERTPYLQCPQGYKWVCAARKKDIEWKKMYDLEYKAAKIRYEELQQFFMSRKSDEDSNKEVTEDGVVTSKGFIYYKEDTLETYLARHGLEDADNYMPMGYGLINSYGIEVIQSLSDEDSMAEWQKMGKKYMEFTNPDSVIVAVDCHM